MDYPAGDIELLDDDSDADEAALERTRKSYADLVEQVTDTRPEPEALAELGAYGMAATLDIALSAKQALLELRSEPARLEQLDGALRRGDQADQERGAGGGAGERERPSEAWRVAASSRARADAELRVDARQVRLHRPDAHEQLAPPPPCSSAPRPRGPPRAARSASARRRRRGRRSGPAPPAPARPTTARPSRRGSRPPPPAPPAPPPCASPAGAACRARSACAPARTAPAGRDGAPAPPPRARSPRRDRPPPRRAAPGSVPPSRGSAGGRSARRRPPTRASSSSASIRRLKRDRAPRSRPAGDDVLAQPGVAGPPVQEALHQLREPIDRRRVVAQRELEEAERGRGSTAVRCASPWASH